MGAARTDVDPHGGTAPGHCAGVVLVEAMGRASAAGMGAGAVADLGVAAQRGGGCPITGAGIKVEQVRLAPGVLARDVRHDSGPFDPGPVDHVRVAAGVGSGLAEEIERDVQFDDAAGRAVGAAQSTGAGDG